ncbi:MAG: ATP-dependent Clp protease ATP-binding subunit ClpA [Bdellovibrio sp.]|jgi:ATP-dependent Clp protease ATP-binding subunit ClpA
MLNREIERRMAEAAENAKKSKHEFVTVEHVLLALTEAAPMSEILRSIGANVPELRKALKGYVKAHCPQITTEQLGAYGGFDVWQPEFTLACHRWIQRAALQVRSAGRDEISEGHLLVALFYEQDSHSVFALTQQGITQFDVINYVSHGLEKDLGPDDDKESSEPKALPHSGGEFEAEKEEKKSPLESFCVNLNERAIDGRIDPLIGRDDVVDRVMQVLCRRTKNNPLLIGEPGVGKTAIAEGLAAKIVQGKTPEALKDKLIYSLDLGSLLAGTKFRGDFEGRLKGVMKEVRKRKNVILFIDEIHTIVGAGATSGGSMDASNLLKPALASGDMSCIGSTTHQEYRQHFEKDRALARRFQRIDVNEPSSADATEILRGLKSRFEEHHDVTYTDEAIKASVELSSKYLHGKLLPDKAIDVMDEAGAWAKLNDKKGMNISDKDIERIIAKMAQVPVASIGTNEKDQLKSLDLQLKSAIFGQDEAIERLVAAIKFSRSGLSRDNKPVGSFLFAGPTGVGKTEVCKQLAQILGIPLVRFDMSEYMEKHTVARLIGAPPGYVGHDEGGQLTEQVNRTGHCVLLLDEMEKAHPDVFNVLLQVMDAGRLTDSTGRTTDFRNVILVMTSNAGAVDVARGTIGLTNAPTRNLSLDAIKKAFAPEFINRLDAVVTFRDLNEGILLQVVRKFVEELQMQLQKKGVVLTVTDAAKKQLLKKGYDPVYGARPLGRAIDEHLKKPLVDELLFGRLVDGGKVTIDLKQDAFDFHFEK